MFGKKGVTPSSPPSESQAGASARWAELKSDLHLRLVQAVDHAALREMDEEQLRNALRIGAEELCRTRPNLLTLAERKRLIDELVDETLGFGPLEPLLRDITISDILINGPRTVYIERDGVLESAPIRFHSDDHLLATVQKIVARVGRRIDESSPMVDARLPDGSRVNAIIAPLAVDGPLVSIRRLRASPLAADDLLRNGTLSPPMLDFLAACVRGRTNILISGGAGSGKTTLLNVLSRYIAPRERVVTIEDAVELRLDLPHVARLETRPPNLEGSGEVTARDLLRNALRMRPDRIIIGECRGEEAFDMLQAMNTGHEGSLTTLHANGARDAIYRLELLVGMSDCDLPARHVQRHIAAAIQIVVQVARMTNGSRRIVQISEVDGIRDGEVMLRDLFSYEEEAPNDARQSQGRFVARGAIPHIAARLKAREIPLDLGIFKEDGSQPGPPDRARPDRAE
jgi:pilus assembly protein CpaF